VRWLARFASFLLLAAACSKYASEDVPPDDTKDAGDDAPPPPPGDDAGVDAPCTPELPDSRYVSDAIQVVAAFVHECALRENGQLVCWGMLSGSTPWPGDAGPNGNGPIAIEGIDDAVKIASTAGAICALDKSTHVRCFGSNNVGELGAGNYDAGPGWVTVVDSTKVPLTGVVDLSAGVQHVCAIVQGGAVACWGSNNERQLGSSSVDGSTPFAVPVTSVGGGAVQLAAGTSHTCVLRNAPDPVVDCWGDDRAGALGVDLDGGTTATAVRFGLAAGGGSTPATLRAGLNATCVFDVKGALFCAGYNVYGSLGALGVGSQRTIPGPVQGLSDGHTLDFSFRNNHSCAIRDDGTVICLGANLDGQLGRGNVDTSPHAETAPVLLEGGAPLRDVSVVATGGTGGLQGISCAVVKRKCASSGIVHCWGSNGFGQFPDTQGTDVVYAKPMPAP
jgi:alpha-tubulin suppressor-like RCC1 family protein